MSGCVGKLCLNILYDLKIELMQGMFSFIILLNFFGPKFEDFVSVFGC